MKGRFEEELAKINEAYGFDNTTITRYTDNKPQEYFRKLLDKQNRNPNISINKAFHDDTRKTLENMLDGQEHLYTGTQRLELLRESIEATAFDLGRYIPKVESVQSGERLYSVTGNSNQVAYELQLGETSLKVTWNRNKNLEVVIANPFEDVAWQYEIDTDGKVITEGSDTIQKLKLKTFESFKPFLLEVLAESKNYIQSEVYAQMSRYKSKHQRGEALGYVELGEKGKRFQIPLWFDGKDKF